MRVEFDFNPGHYVKIKAYGLNFRGRVQRCIVSAAGNLYGCEYVREGEFHYREFLKDELEPV